MRDGKRIENPDLKNTHDTYKIDTNEPGAMSIKLLVGSPNAYVGSEVIKIDPENEAVMPVIENDRTLVPIRFIAESLGMNVVYLPSQERILLTGNGYEVWMTIGERGYTINDITFEMDTEPVVENDRTFIPLRAVSEAIGKTVEWDESNGLIYIGATQFFDRANAAEYARALKEK